MPKFVGAIDVNGAFTLPTADGSADQVLQTNGSGTISWADQSGGGGSPGGSNTQIQFNNSDSFGGSANFTFDGTSTVTLASTDAGSSAAPIIELYRNSSSPADADYLGQIKFQGEDDGGAKVNYAKITAKIDDASNTTEDGIIEIAHMKAGSNNISARFTSTALKLINGTGLEVADGLLTLGSTAVTATAAELNILDGVTATASELNILDGVTSTTAELNILDGVTSTASELNLLDGITAGTVSASLAVIVDSNKDISGFRNVTSSGTGDITTKLEVLSDTEAHSGAVAFYKSEAAGAARLDTNAVYGRLDFYGRTASDGYYLSAQMKALVGDSFSSDNQAPSDIEFLVTPVGQTSPVKKLVVKGGTATTDSAALEIWHPGGDNKGGRVDFIDHDGTGLGYFGYSNNANWYIKNNVSSGNMFIESEGAIYIRAEGEYELSLTSNGLEPYADSGYKLGSSSKKFSEIHGDAIHIGGTEVTATAAELNIMDGVTATATELNIMDGVTSTTAELNILDGVTSTTAELNILDGVTSTAAELNLVDGITAGTISASKAVIVDGNKDLTGLRNVTTTGIMHLTSAVDTGADASDGGLIIGPTDGDHLVFDPNEIMAKNGATSADILYLQADGGSVRTGTNTVLTDFTIKGPLIVGVNDTGHDVIFYGATVDNSWVWWDESADNLLLGPASKLGLGTDATTPAASSLHVNNATPVLTISDTAASNAQGNIQSTIHLAGRYHSGTANPLADLYSDAKIQLYKDNSDGTGGSGLIFSTSATGGGGLTEKLRITKARTIIAHTQDVTGSAETGCLILGDPAGTHMAFDNNEIMAKDAADSASPLYLQNVDDDGADLYIGDKEGGSYIKWNADSDDLMFYGNTFIDFDGTTQSSANQLIDFPHAYTLHVDNAGSGTDSSRVWWGGPDEGEYVIGPRAGSSKFDRVRLRADTIYCEGALTKTSGSFSIPHPTKGGDWQLRHSFIEGPTCDNIYRGTVTLDGGSVTIDLDTVSGMTDGTWEALNTNPWAMVSSSGNAVTWSLSGKILTIEGPDGAICPWMVIGERKDPSIVSSKLTDTDGKLVVEYEEIFDHPDDAPEEEDTPEDQAEEGEEE